MANKKQCPVVRVSIFFLFGMLIAVSSTLPILNPEDVLWRNDQGYFLSLGRSDTLLVDLRYGVFTSLVRTYFVFTENAFVVVLVHKALLLVLFLWTVRKILMEDVQRAIFLFAAFVYLNQFFLRDCMVYMAMLFVVADAPNGTWRRFAGLVSVALLRPQALFFLLRPQLSVLLLFVVAPWYSIASFSGFKSMFERADSFFLLALDVYASAFAHAIREAKVFDVVVILLNLNPFSKFEWFIERGLYLEFHLLLAASVPLIAVLVQMIGSLMCKNLALPNPERIWTGFFCFLVIYVSLGIKADVRVFVAALCPFFVYTPSSWIKWRGLLMIVAIALIAFLLKEGAKLVLLGP